MANISLPSLTQLSGIFPSSTQGGGAGTTISLETAGLQYKGGGANYWEPSVDGSSASINTDDPGATTLDATADGGGIELVRAINETLVFWNDTVATGNNALKYFGASAGNFTISDQSALRRNYQTALYYKLDNTIDSAGLDKS